MFCPKCGKENNDDTNYCQECGFKIAEIIKNINNDKSQISALQETKIADKERKKIIWNWKPKRWLIGLFIFWTISITGAKLLGKVSEFQGKEDGFIIFIMLVYAFLAAFTDRSWKILIRIFWVLGIWIIHALLMIPVCYILLPISPSNLLDKATVFFAAFPLVIWSMRRSKIFVEPV